VKKILSLSLIAIMLLSFAYISLTRADTEYEVIIYVAYPLLENEGIQGALTTFRSDLVSEGWSSNLQELSEDQTSYNYTYFRSSLQYFYGNHNAKGAIFIGDLPFARFKHHENVSAYLTDYYYMDLNGNWTDTNGDGIFDLHTNETGDLRPEIWVGRLKPSKIDGDECTHLIGYFDKNHHNRTASQRASVAPQKALGYFRDYDMERDYLNETTTVLEKAYANVTIVKSANSSKNDYQNRLTGEGVEWLWIWSHGESSNHFDYPGTPHCINYTFYLYDNPKTFFYIWAPCGAANFNNSNNLGGAAIFGSGYGLTSIGMTKSSYYLPEWFTEAFEDLSNNSKCVGDAFMTMYNSLIDWRQSEMGKGPLYFMALLGDPTLRINSPPYTPSQPSGEDDGLQRTTYNYSTNTTDLNGNDVWYEFDWNDGTSSITGSYDSGQSGNASHQWQYPGTYYVRARVKDTHGVWGDWSPNLTVTITERVRFMQNAKWDSTYWKLYWNNTATYTSRQRTQSAMAYGGYLGVKIYKVNDTETLLTDDETNDILPVGCWLNEESGIKSKTWNCSEQNVTNSYIKVEIYYKFSSGSWTYMEVTFRTENFTDNTILNATTWNISLWGCYTYQEGPLRIQDLGGGLGSQATIAFHWGSPTKESCIEDMIFTSG